NRKNNLNDDLCDDLNEKLSEDLNENLNEDLSENLNDDLNEDLSEDLNDDLNEDLSEDLNENLNNDLRNDLTYDLRDLNDAANNDPENDQNKGNLDDKQEQNENEIIRSGASCKHQGAVAMKFNISIFNFFPSLTPDNRMLFAYVALGYTTRDNSFYALLNGKFVSQDRENFNKAKMRTPISDSAIETNENAYNNNETNIVVFMDFLNKVKEDY
ncbi:5111_t:CDS:2, partial [Racocetra persica]